MVGFFGNCGYFRELVDGIKLLFICIGDRLCSGIWSRFVCLLVLLSVSCFLLLFVN